MAGEIDISKLSGAQRAMALAADLDKSGKVDNALEKSIYNTKIPIKHQLVLLYKLFSHI